MGIFQEIRLDFLLYFFLKDIILILDESHREYLFRCIVFHSIEKEVRLHEALHDSTDCTLQRWLHTSVLSKTQNCS